MSDEEADELQDLIKELRNGKTKITDAAIKQQIEAAQTQYKKYKQATQGVDDADSQDSGTGQIDTNSDSAIAAAIKDPALWIRNEMPKELKQANANGLKKATDNGKKKSPKVLLSCNK